MDPHIKKWGITTFKKHFSFILTLFITSIISIIANNILFSDVDFFIKIEFYFALLLTLFCALIALYITHLIEEINKLNITDCISQDITILSLEKHIWIDDLALTKGCDVSDTRVIRNNMKHNYNQFRFRLSSDKEPTPYEGFGFYKDDIKLNPPKDEIKFKSYPEYDITDDPNTQENVVTFLFPVHAKHQEINKCEIRYRTKAFEDGIKGSVDFTQLQINQITEKICVKIHLLGEIAKKNFIIKPLDSNPNDQGSEYDIEVRDISGQRMWSSEEILRKESGPVFNYNSMEWTIYKPKIGYVYRVYFKLVDQ